MLDMSEFGEAAEYLRKSYTEQLKLQTIPFDGKTLRQLSAQPHEAARSQPVVHGSLWRPSPSLPQCCSSRYRGCCRIARSMLEDGKISEAGKAGFGLSPCLLRCGQRWPVISPDPEGQTGCSIWAEGLDPKPSQAPFHSGGVCSVPATLLYHGLLCSGSRDQLAPFGSANEEFCFLSPSFFHTGLSASTCEAADFCQAKS